MGQEALRCPFKVHLGAPSSGRCSPNEVVTKVLAAVPFVRNQTSCFEVYNGPPRERSSTRGERGSESMLGELIGESTGKRSVRRVISSDPPTVEVSFEDTGHMFGVATAGIGTYTSV